MKKTLIYITIGLLFGILGYFATVYYIPYLVMSKFEDKILMQTQGVNQVYYSSLVDEKSRNVVRPNPDFLYSVGFYNLSKGNCKVTAEIPDSTYWSIAFYQDNTVNYFVKNDQQFKNKKVNLVIIPKGKTYTPKQNEEVIQSPTKKGVILTRLLLTKKDETSIKKFKKLQKSFKIKIIKP